MPAPDQLPTTAGNLGQRLHGRKFAKALIKGIAAAFTTSGAAISLVAALLWLVWSQQLLILLASVFLSCEACFAVYYFYVIVKEFNLRPEQHAPVGYEAEAVVKQFLVQISRVQDMKQYLSAWFLDVPFESIRLDNVRELCAYALWYKTMDEMKSSGLMPQLDALMSQLQAIHDIDIPAGYNPDLRFMSHLWDEVPHIYRPLTFYLVMELLELICWVMLAVNGFKRRSLRISSSCTVVYFTRNLSNDVQKPQHRQQQQQRQGASSKQKKKRWWRRQRQEQRQRQNQHATQQQQQGPDLSGIPLVLLHGVGAGLLPYLGVVFSLAVTERPVICPVWKHVSMRLTKYIPTVDDAAEATLAALQRHGAQQAAIIGHSYGTCIAARIAKEKPEVVHTLALIDPVCFAMYMPNLVKFFLYSCHLSGSLLVDGMIALLSSEIHCATNFCRNFFWTSINLWDEHLPERTLVVLSGCDILSPTLYIREWLEQHTKAKVLYNATASHGAGLLLNLEWQHTILQNLLQLVESPTSAAAVAAGASNAGQQGVEVTPGAAAEASAAQYDVACNSQPSRQPGTPGAQPQVMQLYPAGIAAAIDAGYAFDGDEFVGDEFDAMFDAFWGLPEGLGSMSSTAGQSLAEMFDAVDFDRLWDAAASATNSLVAGVVNVVKAGSSATGFNPGQYGSTAMLHLRRRADASGLYGQSCKTHAGPSVVCEQRMLVDCQ